MEKAQISFFFFCLIFTNKIWTANYDGLPFRSKTRWGVYFRMVAVSQKKVSLFLPVLRFFFPFSYAQATTSQKEAQESRR